MRDREAVGIIRRFHPRLPGRANTNDRNPVTLARIDKAGIKIADALTIVARWHGFADWSRLKQHMAALTKETSHVLQFELAVEAIIAGRVSALKSLLREHPGLIKARSTREHSATLLHYVAANGVEGFRQRTPKNSARIMQVLLAAGAEVDADLDYGPQGRKLYPERIGSTTLGLAATSVHPAKAGVQLSLLKTLLKAGAAIDGLPGGWNPVIAALHNGRGDAAAFLAGKGARLDLEGAAGAGRLDIVKDFFNRDGTLKAGATRQQMKLGFVWACEYGHTGVVAFLLRQGVDVAATPHGETGLHWAAYGGYVDIARLLLKRKAPLEVVDRRYRATPLEWALHGWCYPPPEAKRARHHEVVALLRARGAKVPPIEKLDRAQIRKLRDDKKMRLLLGMKNPGN